MSILNKWAVKGRMAAVLMLGAVIALSSGCKEEDPPAISVSDQMFRIGLEAENLKLRVMSNTNWTAEENADWITLSRVEGRGSYDITIFVDPYDGISVNGRQTTITFSTGGSNPDIATVIVNQGISNAKLQISPPTFTIGSEGGNVGVMVTSNTTWTVFGQAQAPGDWATPSVTSGSGNQPIMFTVDQNTTGMDRELIFYIMTKAGSDQQIEEFILIQTAVADPTLIIAQTELFFEAIVEGTVNESIFVPFITNVTDDPIVSSGQTWCTATVMTNNSVSGVLVTVTDNAASTSARECIITVIAVVDGKSVTKQIHVTQAGAASPDLTIFRSSITIPAKGTGTGNVIDFSVGYFKSGSTVVTLVQDYDSWITTTHNASTMMVAGVAEENLGDLRTTSITLTATAAGESISKSVIIIQEAASSLSFSLSTYALNIPVGGENIEFYAFANELGTEVVAAPTQPWITSIDVADAALTGYSGTVKLITATIDANLLAASRQGTITVIGAYGLQNPIPLTLTVLQDGAGSPSAVLARNSITIPAEAGGPYNIGISGVGTLTPTVTADMPWITGAAYSAADKSITFSAMENTALTARTGYITVTLTSGGETQFLMIEVTQLGSASAELQIYQEEWEVEAPAITINVPIIPMNGTTWTVLSATPLTTMIDGIPAATDQELLSISVLENTTTVDRKGTVVLLATNGESQIFYTIAITQKGIGAPDLTPLATEVHLGAAATLANNELIIPFLGGSADITYTSLYFENPSMFAAATLLDNSTPADTFLQIAVNENTATTERVGVIRVAALRGGAHQIIDITVYQAAADSPNLIFPGVVYNYGPAAIASTTVFFDNPNGATVSFKSVPAWITAGTAGVDNVEFAVAANDTDEIRSGYILLKAAIGNNTATYSVLVSQAGLAPLGASLVSTNLEVPWSAGVATDKLIINNLPAGLTAADIAVSFNTTWLTAPTVTVTGTQATIELTVGVDNPRTTIRNAYTSIVITSGNLSQVLNATVTQEGAPGPTVTLAQSVLYIPANSAAATVYPVTLFNSADNVTYTIASDNSAFVTAAVDGTNHILEVTNAAGVNTGNDNKEATITVQAEASGVTSSLTLKVVQYGVGAPDMTLGSTGFIFGATAQTAVNLFYFNHNGAVVSIASKPAWVTDNDVTAISDFDGAYVFDVAANTDLAERSGIITLKAVLGSQVAYYDVSVVQSSIAEMNISVVPTGVFTDETSKALPDTFFIVGIPADATSVDVTSLQTWLTLDPYTSPANTFTASVTNNETVYPRVGTILVKVTRGNEIAISTVNVLQMPAILVSPEGFVNPSSLTFPAAGATEKTVTLGNVESTYTYFVSAPDWVTVSAVTVGAGTATFTVVPIADNAGETRTGVVSVFVNKGGVSSQTITIPVTQTGIAPLLIFPATYSVSFDANSTATANIDILNFDPSYTFSASQSGNWFTFTNPASPMTITPNEVWTGVSPRKGSITATISKAGVFVTSFTITVIQNGIEAPNITYAPKTHTSVPVAGTAAGVPLRTTFINPAGLALAISSTVSPDFIMDATIVGNELQITVAPSANSASRQTEVVVTATAGGNVVGVYPVKVIQDGTSAASPLVQAQFTDGDTMFVTASGTFTPGMILSPGVTILSASLSTPQAWISGVASTPTGITFAIDEALFGATNESAVIEVTLRVGGTQFTMYYHVKHLVMPLIGASISPSPLMINASDTSVGSGLVTIANPEGATVANIETTYANPQLGAWFDAVATQISVQNGELTITGIPANTTTADRSALIVIKLTKVGYQDQYLNFILTQKGIPVLNAIWPKTFTAVYSDTDLTAEPTSADGATIKAGSIDFADVDTWVTTAPVSSSGAGIDFVFSQNLSGSPRYGHVTFTMERAGYQDQEESIFLVQMPQSTVNLIDITSVPTLAYNAGSTGTILYSEIIAGTTVTVYNYDGTFSSVSPSLVVTSAAINATGADRTGAVLLKAINGTEIEWVEVPIVQKSITPTELNNLITLSAGEGVNSVSHGADHSLVTATASSVGIGFANNALINISGVLNPPGITPSLSLAANPASGQGLNMSSATITMTRIGLQKMGFNATGTTVLTATITLGGVSTAFSITFTIS